MGKIVRLTESDLVRLVKKVIKEQNTQYGSFGNNPYNPLMDQNLKGPHFEIDATVEGDMLITFDVYGFIVQNGKVGMIMKEQGDETSLIVYNFGGPIFDKKTNNKVYTDVSFGTIGPDNYMSMAKKNGVSVIKK